MHLDQGFNMSSLAGGAAEVVACCICGSILGDVVGAALEMATDD